MGNKLLVRAYNVEVGDCIYVRIPNAKVVGNKNEDFHMLIDCGTRGQKLLVKNAMEHLEGELPDADGNGKKRLDLIVVTHEHDDHIKGFDPEYFENIEVDNIWLTAAMNPAHPQAQESNNLHALATREMRAVESSGLALGPELESFVSLFSINNEGAKQALQEILPADNDIEPTYVQAGTTSDSEALGLSNTVIRVLAPEENIDFFYLGDDNAIALHGLQKTKKQFAKAAAAKVLDVPKNISSADFRRLRSRMLSSSLAFAELDSVVKNNTCAVLLIEWGKRRLLFVGDAEWEGEFSEGKHNGSWNVMWHQQRELLDQPIDFLKIGHHGSTNATPWDDTGEGEPTEARQILDAILPIPNGNSTAQAVVSTGRTKYKTIPKSALLAELGTRVANVRDYQTSITEAGLDPSDLPRYEEFERDWLGLPQPMRTDLEYFLDEVGFVDVWISP